MKFGLFYEIQVPKPWYESKEFDIYQQVLDQVELADELGFETFWTVEHHFLTEFSHCSAPEVLYGAVSQRTKRIKIGHGVVLLPFPYNHPIRVAERIAVLDLLSNGRVNVGTGRSATEAELAGFGIPPEETRARWEEALEMLPRMWMDETFSWDGRYFKVPPRQIIPKPRQQPHPPIWQACSSAAAHETAGRKGLGLLSFTFLVELAELAKRIAAYRRGIKEARPVGAFINEQTAVFTLGYCGESPAEARNTAAESMVWATRRGLENALPLARIAHGDYAYLRQVFGVDANTLTFDYLNDRDLIVVGDPEECIRKLRGYQAASADHILLMQQVGNIPHAKVMGSIERFAKYVMPQLA
jgi:alkanesulfonate monooxygenase SsuD/methylene tetrahydromethanopterin reductase-like flavin-dependent oxidoreductase (luciferase family)